MQFLSWVLPLLFLAGPSHALRSGDEHPVQNQLISRDALSFNNDIDFLKARDLDYLRELDARALSRDISTLQRRNWALTNLNFPTRRQELSYVARRDGLSDSLVRRAPATVPEVNVAMWDLAYMDTLTGDSKLYEISADKPKGQKATGTLWLKTDSLSTCVALAIVGPGGAVLGHFPPAFCSYLNGDHISADWQTKATNMKAKLAKTLDAYKGKLQGGRAYIVHGYVSTVATHALQQMLAPLHLTVRDIQSTFGHTAAARSVVIQRNPDHHVSVTVDGHLVT